jgi:hypothetical protein
MPFNNSNPADHILTEDEVAALTSFSTRTLQAWRQRMLARRSCACAGRSAIPGLM